MLRRSIGCFRQISTNIKRSQPILSATYKSIYNLENLYPNSTPDYSTSSERKGAWQLTLLACACWQQELEAVKEQVEGVEGMELVLLKAEDGAFTGFIPLRELEVKHLRGSGPGGQNVNKVNTKVEVRFHVETAEWVPKEARYVLLQQEKNRINKEGYLIVSSDKTRKQLLNQADCLEKIRQMVRLACTPDVEPSQDDFRIMSLKKEKARQEILREKKRHSLKKSDRVKF